MGTKPSIYQKPNIGNYYTMSPQCHAMVKKVWEYVEKNPAVYGNGFFISLCDKHPKFLNYYSKQGTAPLQVDLTMSAKFTLILETMGYFIVDCYNNPKQLDKLIGYTAMVHKDMRADIQHFLDFTSHLVDYLSKLFPVEMTLEYQKDLNNYLSSISYEIVSRIETFLKYEIMGLDESSGFLFCSPCFANNLIFGQTLLYWKNRKRIWENKMNEIEAKNSEPLAATSTEEESALYKFETEDELTEWTTNKVTSLERQKLHHTLHVSTTDADSTPHTNGKRTNESNDYSGVKIMSSIHVPLKRGSLKKPESQTEKLYIQKHVTMKSSIESNEIENSTDNNKPGTSKLDSPRQRFRSKSNQSHSNISIIEGLENMETEVISARQRRRMKLKNSKR